MISHSNLLAKDDEVMAKVYEEKPWKAREEKEKKLRAWGQKKLGKFKSGEEKPKPKIQELLESDHPGSLLNAIRTNIKNPFKEKGKRYDFAAIMLVVIVAACCGFSGPTDVARFLIFNISLFYPFFDKIPTHDTFRDYMLCVNTDELANCLDSWLDHRYPTEVKRGSKGRLQISLDGKADRAATKKADGDPTQYMLDGLVDGYRMLCQIFKIDKKTNEQAHIGEYIEKLAEVIPLGEKPVLSIDAAGATKGTIEVCDKLGFDFFISLKENQSLMYNAITHAIRSFERRAYNSTDENEPIVHLDYSETYIEEEYSHGRKTTYKVRVIRNAREVMERFGLRGKLIYDNTKSIVIIETKRISRVKGKMKTTYGTRYYISSIFNLDSKEALRIRRKHWLLEAKHWVLDFHLGEDQHTTRAGRGMENWSVARRFAVALHSAHPFFLDMPFSAFRMACVFDVEALVCEFLS